MTVIAADDEGFARRRGIIAQGGLVAFPTETVYGLGADATKAWRWLVFFRPKVGRPSTR